MQEYKGKQHADDLRTTPLILRSFLLKKYKKKKKYII